MNNKYKKYLSIFLLVISFLLIGILTLTTSFTVFVGDDYSHALSIGVYNVGFLEYLKAVFSFVKNVYLTWQGTYSAMFFQALLSPLNNGGFTSLRIIMILNCLLLFLSIFLFIFKGLNFNKDNFFIKSILFFLVTVLLIVYISYEETFYWFSGSTSYSMPLIFTINGITLYLLYRRNKKLIYIILSMLCGIVTGGASLTVVALGCYINLLIVLYDIFKNKKVDSLALINFLIWLICGLINVLAPGNYLRFEYETGTSSFNLIQTLYYAFLMWGYRGLSLLSKNILLLSFLIAILLGYKYGNKDNLKLKVIFSLLTILTPFVVAFPVALSMGDKLQISKRIMFIMDIGLILAILLIGYTLGTLINKYKPAIYNKLKYLSIIVGILSLIFIKPTNIININRQLINGDYKEYYDTYIELTDYLSILTWNKVGIPSKMMPKDLDGFYNFYLNDWQDWVNKSIAQYYNLITLALEND